MRKQPLKISRLFGMGAIAALVIWPDVSLAAAEKYFWNFRRQGVSPAEWLDSKPSTSGWYPDKRHGASNIPHYDPAQLGRDSRGLKLVASSNARSPQPSDIRSGIVWSRRAFLFGTFRIRAKFPSGKGLWPAVWLVTPPDRILSGEIDIVEGFGSRPDVIQSTLHPWKAAHEDSQECVLLYLQGQIDPSFHPHSPCARATQRQGAANTLTTQFHEYKLVWAPNRITWYFDGASYYTTTSKVPKTPMNLVINLGVSVKNQWDGAPDESTDLPKSLVVESVSVEAQ